jgi:chromatin structure-remodeling complex subunit RSC1/2
MNSTYSNISNIATYKAPQPIETWSLHDAANNNIPPDIREQFLTDDQGRVLFFTAPPVEFEGGGIAGSVSRGGMWIDGAADQTAEGKGGLVGHSSEYTAWKLKNKAEREAQREKRRAEASEERDTKRSRMTEETQKAIEKAKNGLLEKAVGVWARGMGKATVELERGLQGERGVDTQ